MSSPSVACSFPADQRLLAVLTGLVVAGTDSIVVLPLARQMTRVMKGNSGFVEIDCQISPTKHCINFKGKSENLDLFGSSWQEFVILSRI